jgi:hypothetical protein
MLIALITGLLILFGGGGTLEHYLLNIKKPVEAVVEGKSTVKAMAKLSKSLGKELKQRNKELTSLNKEFLDLHEEYNVTVETCEAVIDRMVATRQAGQRDTLRTRHAMKQLVSDEEWRAIFALDP